MFRSLRWYRYVWSELAPTFLLGLLLLTFLLLMNAFFLIAEKTLAKGLGWPLTFQLFAVEVPRLLVMAIPMAVLLGALVAVGRLSADQEWTAIQSAGFGPPTLLRPVVAFGLAATAVTFFIYGAVFPRAHFIGRNLHGQVLFMSNLATDLRPGSFYTQIPKTVLFVENIRSSPDRKLEGVFAYMEAPHGDRDQVVMGRYGDLFPVGDGSGDLALRVFEGVLVRYAPAADGAQYEHSRFGTTTILIPAPPFLRQLRDSPTKTVSDMTPPEVYAELVAARGDTAAHPTVRGHRIRNAEFELHRRFALPMAALLFSGLAVPLGIRRARSGKGAGFALSLAVILLYWIVFTTTQKQALSGVVPVWVGAWSANLLVAAWAGFAYWRMRRPWRQPRRWLSRLAALPARLAGAGRPVPAGGTASPAAPGEALDEALADLGGTPTRFIARLDQYVVVQYLRHVVYAGLAAYLIYSIVELKRLLDGALKNDESLLLLARYFLYALPGMLNVVLPIACLVGGIIVFTLLSRTGELTAIKASGISMHRVTVPVVVLTLLLCAALFFVQDQVLVGGDDGLQLGWALAPATNRKAEELKDRILGRSPATYGTTAGRWAFGPDGKRLYHYRLYDADRDVFHGFSVLTLDRSRPWILDHRFSSDARWDGRSWTLGDGWYRTFPEDGALGIYDRTAELRTDALDPPDRFARREASLTATGNTLQEQMSLADLTRQIDDLTGRGYDTTRLRVAYWGKLAQPFAPLVMVLLGLPFGFRVGRRGSLYGIGVAILLVIVYWATFAVFNALGLETILPPVLAAWTPNVIYGALGIYLLLYIRT